MSNFKFQVEKVNKLGKAKTIVIDGVLINGSITTGSFATLMKDEGKKMLIKGVVLGESKSIVSQKISLVIDSTKEKNIINSIQEGDFLVGN
jgi:hypothetical protein